MLEKAGWMFLGWNGLLPEGAQNEIQAAFIRRRIIALRFDKPVLQSEFPRCLQIDPWTNRLLLSSSSSTLCLTDLDTLSVNHRPFEEQALDCAWYPFDSGLFVTSSSEKVRLWDTERLAPVRSIKVGGRCNQVAFSSCPASAGNLAVATSHGEIRLVNLLTGSAAYTLASGIDSEVLCVSWSVRDSFIIASGSADSRILIWDVRKLNGHLFALDEHSSKQSARSEWETHQGNGSVIRTSRLSTAHSRSPVTSISFLEDGKSMLSTASDGTIRLWREGALAHNFYNSHVSYSRRLSGPWGATGFKLCYSRQTSVMFFASPGSENIIQSVDMLSGDNLGSYSAHVRKVRCLAFREDTDAEMFSAADDGFVLKWSCPRRAVASPSNGNDDEDYWSS